METLDQQVARLNHSMFPEGFTYDESNTLILLAASVFNMHFTDVKNNYSLRMQTGYYWDDAILAFGALASKSDPGRMKVLCDDFPVGHNSATRILACAAALTDSPVEEVKKRFSSSYELTKELISASILALAGALSRTEQPLVENYYQGFQDHTKSTRSGSILTFGGLMGDMSHAEMLAMYKDPRLDHPPCAAIIAAASTITGFRFDELALAYRKVRGTYNDNGKAFAAIAMCYAIKNDLTKQEAKQFISSPQFEIA